MTKRERPQIEREMAHARAAADKTDAALAEEFDAIRRVDSAKTERGSQRSSITKARRESQIRDALAARRGWRRETGTD